MLIRCNGDEFHHLAVATCPRDGYRNPWQAELSRITSRGTPSYEGLARDGATEDALLACLLYSGELPEYGVLSAAAPAALQETDRRNEILTRLFPTGRLVARLAASPGDPRLRFVPGDYLAP